jgi:hypothetical protein
LIIDKVCAKRYFCARFIYTRFSPYSIVKGAKGKNIAQNRPQHVGFARTLRKEYYLLTNTLSIKP